mgnify:CR=1 FL=1
MGWTYVYVFCNVFSFLLLGMLALVINNNSYYESLFLYITDDVTVGNVWWRYTAVISVSSPNRGCFPGVVLPMDIHVYMKYPCIDINVYHYSRFNFTFSSDYFIIGSPYAVREINDKVMNLHRAFLDPQGIPGREYLK